MPAKDGVHADELRALMFRLGATTTDHASTMLGLPRSTAHTALAGLLKSKDAERRDRRMPWWGARRGVAPAHYFLSRKNGATGILAGAAANGEEVRDYKDRQRVLERYAMNGVPYAVPHCWLRNDLFACLVAGSGSLAPDLDVSVPVEELQGESFAGFPLTEGVKKIRPDGGSTVCWEDGHGELIQSFWVEAETNERRGELLKKIENYSARWFSLRSKVVDEVAHELLGLYAIDQKRAAEIAERRVSIGFSGLHPVIFVYPRRDQAVAMRRYARKAAEERRRELASHLSLREQWAPHRLDPGNNLLFCGLDEVRARGPFAGEADRKDGCFMPMQPYPDGSGGNNVSLYDVACRLWEAYRNAETARQEHVPQDDEARRRLAVRAAERRDAGR